MARPSTLYLAAVFVLCNVSLALTVCPFTGNITGSSEVKLHRSTGGSLDVGLHTLLTIDVQLTNAVRFLECAVAVRLSIPNGAHVDLDALAEDNIEYAWTPADAHSIGWDGELPAEASARTHLWLCSRKPLVNSFLFADAFTLPVNLRYHAATQRHKETPHVPQLLSDRAEVKFLGPEVFVRCERDEITRWPECKKHMVSAPCNCGAAGDNSVCGYARVPKTGVRTLVLRVPVGNLSHLWPTLIATILAVALCLAYILYNVACGTSVALDDKKTQ